MAPFVTGVHARAPAMDPRTRRSPRLPPDPTVSGRGNCACGLCFVGVARLMVPWLFGVV